MMRWYSVFLFLALLLSTLGVASTRADSARAALRARMALLRVRTATSSDRVIAVSGPRSDANALLLEAVQQTVAAIEDLLGIPFPRSGQRVRILVLSRAGGADQDLADVALRTESAGDDLIHRVTLPDYESAYLVAAREAVVYAILSAYILDVTGARVSPDLPVWFWQGVMEMLHPDDRELALGNVDARWRSGGMPPLGHFLRGAQVERLSASEAMIAGALLYWLASRPSDEGLMPAILAQIGSRKPLDLRWLQKRWGADPDALFDRWIVEQRRAVRGIGTVMPTHIAQLRSTLLLYPGQHGIPQRERALWGAPLYMLVAYRDARWSEEAIRQRRQRLELAAQGRPARFRAVVDEFLRVLDGVAAGTEKVILEEKTYLAYMSLDLLAQEVEASGGVWRAQE